MGIQDKFTAEEWRTLQFAPFWVYASAAHVDGEDDYQKRTILAKELTKAAVPMKGVSDIYISDLLVRDVLVSLLMNLEKVQAEYAKVSPDTISGLNKVVNILNQKATPHQAQKFKNAMLHLGQKIAEGPSKESPDKGGEVSEKGKAALSLIASALQVADYERGSHIDRIVEEHLKSEKSAGAKNGAGVFFTTGELNTLLFAPLWVANLVAGVDGKIDQKANKAMNEELNVISQKSAFKIMEFIVKLKDRVQSKEQLIPKSEAEFAQSMMAEGFSLIEALFPPASLLSTKEKRRDQQIQDRFIKDSRSAAGGLAEVANILNKKSIPEQAREFKDFLLQVGQSVAKATGGSFFGIGGKIGKKKKAALAQVSEALKMMPDSKISTAAAKKTKPAKKDLPKVKKGRPLPKKKPKPGEATVGDAIKVAIQTQDLEILSVLIKAIEKKTGHSPAAIFQLANQVSGISKSEWERLLKKMNL